MIQVVNCYLAAGGGAAPFAPDDLASLQAWYDASLLTGSDGDRKTTWPDQTANAYNATASLGPVLKTGANGLNSLNVLQWAHALNEPLTMSSSLLNGATAGSAFCVVKDTNDPAANDAQSGGWFNGFTSDTSGTKNGHYPYTDSKIYPHFGSTVRGTGLDPTPSLASWRLFSEQISGSAGSAVRSMFIDGTSIGTQSSLTVNFGAVARWIGSSIGGTGQFFEGKMAELLFFNADLGTTDRQKVEGYLAWKWGLQANLPGGHPYAGAAP